MKALLDANGNVTPAVPLSQAKDFTQGVIENPSVRGIVRIKAITVTRVALFGDNSEGTLLAEGETEYFIIPEGRKLNILSGKVNVMY